ncbi:hypothetical protein [Desulfonatronum thiodismutans]|nr:hypothetical protein [Desulfonatronum thiodismutans]
MFLPWSFAGTRKITLMVLDWLADAPTEQSSGSLLQAFLQA